jgi:hypothetical protein
VLVAPPAGAAWRIDSVALADAGIEVGLVVDFVRLIG